MPSCGISLTQMMPCVSRCELLWPFFGSPPDALRCQYKSRNFVSADDVSYVTRSARSLATSSTCDDWRVPAGTHISLFVFNYAPAAGAPHVPTSSFRQHQHWFPTVEMNPGNH